MTKKEKRALGKFLLFIIALPIVLPIIIILLIIKIVKHFKKTKQKKKNNDIVLDETIYHKREFITEYEKQFMSKLTGVFNNKYIIQPQIPLRMIVSKNNDKFNKYASELNRYIDFGIFNKNYELQALIELNDKTHELEERQERDLKVQNICRQAKIPLITFWTYEKLTNEEIKHRIEKEINNAK